jgi:hypothetical protein
MNSFSCQKKSMLKSKVGLHTTGDSFSKQLMTKPAHYHKADQDGPKSFVQMVIFDLCALGEGREQCPLAWQIYPS